MEGLGNRLAYCAYLVLLSFGMRIVHCGSDKRSHYHRQNNLVQKSGWIFQQVLKIYK